MEDILKKLGPLAKIAGTWEGDKGNDLAPSDDRGTETNLFREQMVFEPFGPINNHEQELWGLRYKTTAWRIGEADAFHEETGYWLWDGKEKQVMRAFLVPRGVTVLAGGTVEEDASEFTLKADLGSNTYGICSNPFLDREFKTTHYEVTVKVTSDSLEYEEDTVIQMKGKRDLFHHRDKNKLKRITGIT